MVQRNFHLTPVLPPAEFPCATKLVKNIKYKIYIVGDSTVKHVKGYDIPRKTENSKVFARPSMVQQLKQPYNVNISFRTFHEIRISR